MYSKFAFWRVGALFIVLLAFSSYQPDLHLTNFSRFDARRAFASTERLPVGVTTSLPAEEASITDKKDEILIRVIMQGLKIGHYELKDVGDDFSKEAFNIYLEKLDYNKLFFTQADVNKLRKYELRIDDEVKKGSYEFFELSSQMFERRIDDAETLQEKILSKPFDFSKEETFESDADKRAYARNEKELRERWRRALKYQTLGEIYNRQKAQEEKDEAALPFDTLEARARAKVLKKQQDTFKRMRKIEKNDRLTLYINAIAGTYDPHTDYYPPKDKENFDISISGQFEGIGASLQEQPDGYIKVTEIIPGSASWRQGRLAKGDLILKVGQGEEEPVNVVDMRVDHAVKLIRGPKGTVVTLTVKKVNGTTEAIPITRDVVILEDTYAKSAILEDEQTGLRTGYIFLPVFYADFNNDNGRSCAEDVRLELEKLQAAGVDGVVLDLRNNGGGSLQDVVEMAGLFIETGPVVQVKSRAGAPHVLRDKDTRVQYDGPLVLMVNSFSASASEILAAAMQDYGRGVVIGGAATYGKGTVQRFYNLDNFVSDQFEDVKPLGAIKLTTQKFYRIDGHATQLKGVTPDIVLPDAYSFLDIGEKEQKYAMAWDEIKSLKYDRWTPTYQLDSLRAASERRTEDNPTFELIAQKAQQFRKRRDYTEYTLNYAAYREQMNTFEAAAKQFEDLQQEISQLSVEPIMAESEASQDSTVMARAERFRDKLKKDLYVYEAIHVVEDMRR